jgi:hypothetical protein
LNAISKIVVGAASSTETSSVSTAEYIDTVRACLELNVPPHSDLFENLARVTVWKHGRTRPTTS